MCKCVCVCARMCMPSHVTLYEMMICEHTCTLTHTDNLFLLSDEFVSVALLCLVLSMFISVDVTVCVCQPERGEERQRFEHALHFGFVSCVVWCWRRRERTPLTPPHPLTPICPVRVSHKVQSLLIAPVPDGRFMEDESGGTNQISSPVWS